MDYPKAKSENYTNLGGINTKISPYIQGPTEFLDLQNFDFSVPGSITKAPGSTTLVQAGVVGKLNTIYDFQNLEGYSAIIVSANTNIYAKQGATIVPIAVGFKNDQLFSFVTFVDRLFGANGNDFFKFNGVNSFPVGLPSLNSASLAVTPSGSGSMSGNYVYSLGYLNERGFLGSAILGPSLTIGVTASTSSDAQVLVQFPMAPSGFGITAQVIYRSGPEDLDLFQIGYASPSATSFTDTNLPQSTIPAPNIIQMTLAPKYLEIYNNMLVTAGFSSLLSQVFPSGVGEPEDLDQTVTYEVRTNDGDKILALKTYLGNCLVFKQRSFHALGGFDPSNLQINSISDEYGCLSHRATAVYNQNLLFLDQKGIAHFNGANVEIVSNKVEPIFLRMNIQAAVDQAAAIHVKNRNEVWFVIPVDGATLNNMIVVYDYYVNAFTTFTGKNVACLTVSQSQFPQPTVVFSSYDSSIQSYGASFTSHSGATITCVAQTHFLRDLGESVEKQWRRLFMNSDLYTNPNNVLSVNFFSNYGATIIVGRTMALNIFQPRIDFGIPAKSLSAQFIHQSASDTIRIHGYTIESRYQRAV